MLYYDKKVAGARIKEARRRKKMTQCRLAESLDYTTERQLQRIENGETSCSVDKLMEIAQILEVSTDYILFGLVQDNSMGYRAYFEGKTERQKEYLCMILETAAKNLDILR